MSATLILLRRGIGMWGELAEWERFQGRGKEPGPVLINLPAAAAPQHQQDVLVRPVMCPSKKLPPSSPGGSWLQQGKLSAAFPLLHVLLPISLPGTQQSSRGDKVKWDRFPLLPQYFPFPDVT